jgi:bifunctional non-homologous end joining protein LigD
MDRLDEYRRKRDFSLTPEPAGEAAVEAGEGLFVVHKHAARRLHHDLRLEQDGVLRSWALPKGPSLAPGEKRLAVEVEDHPLAYADFEGIIPAGEYGGGTVMLWDRGRWTPTGDGVRDGRIDFVLEGSKLRGAWTLTRMGGAGEDGTNWLLIKRRDAGGAALAPDERSVASGRTMEQIAAAADRTWSGAGDGDATPEGPGARAPRPGEAVEAIDPSALPGARPSGGAAEPELQLATLVDAAPAGDAWIHEIKFDGYRIVASIADGRVRLSTRNGHDWTDRFGALAAALRRLPVRRAVLDGEVVALRGDGVTSFGELQEALSAGATERLRYQAFDLLHLDDHDLRGVAQADRKAALSRLLSAAALGPAVRYTDHVEGQGPAFLAHACRMGLEGIVSKRRDAPYRRGRGRRWLKAKCTRHDEFVVGGYTPPAGSRSGFGALLLGAYRDGALVYAGRVGSGFSDRRLERLHAALRELERPTSPFEGSVPDARGATWVEPVIVVEVAFTERTRDGRLRHPTFRGVREDKDASEVVLTDAPEPADAQPARARAAAAPDDAGPPAPARTVRSGGRRVGPRGRDDAEVVGVRLSNANRILYPEQGITKLALAQYYESVQEHVLPGLLRRPLALVRCPQGTEEACFYQKHPGEAFARDLPRVTIEERSGPREYAYVESVADLVRLVQAGVLEIHVWGCRIDAVERPDLLVIDLDPGPDVPWDTTRATAVALRDRLQGLGLHPFARTTGGKGLHIVVPLARRHGWDEVKAFARALCEQHAASDPRRLVTTSSKAKRQGKIYLDYLRNGRGATAIASYSTRARAGAPVAVPVRWDELDARLRPDRYTVGNVRRRLAALRDDPWEGFAAAARSITQSMRDAVGMR